jgi:hypothetical protein
MFESWRCSKNPKREIMDHRVLPFDVTRRVTRGVRGKEFNFENERDTKILHHMCIAPTIISGELVSREDIGKVRKVLELNRDEEVLLWCGIKKFGFAGIFPIQYSIA